MTAQRVPDAESGMRNNLSNGPQRAQGKVFLNLVFCDVRHTSVAGKMKVFRKVRESNREAGWHREFLKFFCKI